MLVCGQPPFQEANDSETLTMIMDCKYTVPPHVSRECKDLITRMLQRDPKRRASLEEIENHAWLQGVDPSPATKYNIPLVSYKNLSEEEHNSIIQRMVLGDIADRDTIVEALETNKYNHITATYFLLAERILREKQEKEIQTRSASPSNIKAQFRQSWPTKIDVPQDLEDDLTATPLSHATVPQSSPARTAENVLNGHRSKALADSTKKEEIPELAGPALSAVPSVSLKPTTSGRKCLFRVEEDEEEDEEDKKPISLSTQVVLRRKPSVTNRLTSRKSAPVLNQIFEEGESDDDAGELVESLKLMSLCLGSQIHGSTKYIIDPQNNLSFSSVKVQEKSSWKMCISSSGSANQPSSLGSLKFFSDQMSDTTNELERLKNRNLKNNVLQLPLCEKISVNIQRNPKEGLLCTSSQTSCCHVI
ncbi:hypothetical protein EK904_005207 [Melospiza melodia maxima]|nr:hypothetical protein EK904_005207 [Melospiza melodia maxima]